ncbi:S-adenosylmethionine sensor upstream of mTORC1 [Chrysoperla carnea]|uniref:S-adenosylmethionine sensor upstream of mTORC1 n=1 Tax=Chrysoperla carnea TaxID=189513 RepID=UPI001D0862F0|nr:S-adenosylmethionine sensor upstream of mTORC1 [Chrysoperla carnea]
MASEEQKELANFIKSLHTNLRTNAKIHGADTAWESHKQQKQVLEKYAKYMETLAIKYWEPNSDNQDKTAFSRIKWCVQECEEYFPVGLQYHRQREIEIIKKIGKFDSQNVVSNNMLDKLRLLDVGSCYNPFKAHDNLFKVTAIDLCPANVNVKKCDFLKVDCVNSNINLEDDVHEIKQLPAETFDIIVFSLLLEYLPSSDQRVLCCTKAYKLLKSEGILIIITPDSKHVGANAKLMKSWRYTLSNLGFMRIKYEKLAHVHCLIFRKCLYPEVGHRWVEMHQNDGFTLNVLNIPQDFVKFDENVTDEIKENCDSSLFTELPLI